MLRALARDGWTERRREGGHIVLHHPTKSGRPVVSYHRGKTIKPRTFRSILQQAGLTVDQLRELL